MCYVYVCVIWVVCVRRERESDRVCVCACTRVFVCVHLWEVRGCIELKLFYSCLDMYSYMCLCILVKVVIFGRFDTFLM